MKMRVLQTLAYGFVGMAAVLSFAPGAWAAAYDIDPAHSFVEFRISHLGYSTLVGRFNRIAGGFEWDRDNPAGAKIAVTVQTASVDTNHAERDKHLRNDDFLDVKRYPEAVFTSTKYTGDAAGGQMEGRLTLHGVTRPVTLEVKVIGEGPDPWGGYRSGFSGTTSITRRDFGMEYQLGPASESMELNLFIEGIRKK